MRAGEMFRSLRAQLSIAILLVLLLTTALVSLFGGWFINREFEQYVARQEQARSESIVRDLGSQYSEDLQGWSQEYLHAVGMYSLYDGYILKVYADDDRVLWDAENHDMSLCGQIMNDITSRMENARSTGGFTTRIYDVSQDGLRLGSVSITYYGPYFYSENDFRFITALNGVLVATGLLAALFSVLVGGLLARRIARPITETAYVAKQIAKGDYSIRCGAAADSVAGSARELEDLVGAINHLAASLEEQESLRKRLTTDIAHELRTPLTAVGSHLEAMISGIWEPTPERLAACHQEIQRLGRLVASLQQLAKVEGEGFALQRAEVDLLEVVRFAAETLLAVAAKKTLSLTVAGEASVVLADRERMVQVVTNLLANAIEYTPEGGSIQVTVADDARFGSITVDDNGSGIAKDDLPLIFERFYRTDKSRNRKTGGAGIGLAIAKSIVAAHGGTINAESEPEQGSRFTVTLPK